MAEICKNCENEIEVNFCSNCGQKKAKRIDRTYIKDEIQYTVFHMNKGFFYSVKKILRAPGKTTREFIEGNRVNHYKPLVLVFVLAGISAFLSNTLLHPTEMFREIYANQDKMAQLQLKLNTYIFKYYAIIMFLCVPPMALVSWLSFKKWGYNYYENIIISANFFSLYLILNIIVILPIQFIVMNTSPTMTWLMITFTISMVIFIAQFFWFYIDLYNTKEAGQIVLRVFLMFVLMFIAYILAIIVGMVGLLIYANATGFDLKTMFPAPK